MSAITLKIPPLRERTHDIHLLADPFVRAYAGRYGRNTPRLGADCLAALAAYSFPGNVRELESEISRLVAVSPSGASIGADVLKERITGADKSTSKKLAPMSLAEMEKRLIADVLTHTEGNRTRAAEILGISREGLRTKMQRLGLSGSD